MGNLYFPQLQTGAIAHFPVQRTLLTRTVANTLPGGDLVTYADEQANKKIWSWDYVGLTLDEAAAVQQFFEACDGPLKPFTFLDPMGNLLASSANFRTPAWQLAPAMTIVGDLPSPISRASAVTIVNNGEAIQEFWQTLTIPANYMYCFSMYVSSDTPQEITMFRRSGEYETAVAFEASSQWSQIWSSGNLQDQTPGLSVGIRLSPGQQISMCAPQLEPQPRSSPFRTGIPAGDVYRNAHWAVDELSTYHVAPNNCTVSVSIEA